MTLGSALLALGVLATLVVTGVCSTWLLFTFYFKPRLGSLQREKSSIFLHWIGVKLALVIGLISVVMVIVPSAFMLPRSDECPDLERFWGILLAAVLVLFVVSLALLLPRWWKLAIQVKSRLKRQDSEVEMQEQGQVQESAEENSEGRTLLGEICVEESRTKLRQRVRSCATMCFWISFVLINFAALFFGTVGVSLMRSSMPKEYHGLKARVERVDGGVVHISADNDPDLFFAQGVEHCRERLFQMEFNRRAARGRLSEIVGSSTIDVDKFTRTLGLGQLAEETARTLAPATRAVVQAYVDGVNA
mmetsp:Transcript_44164/g.95807  ORF Transcript_44164/g.95807 Transcript_44164/m.95807 type:complete len:305 (-) Transcript_44164:2969-3883(-)